MFGATNPVFARANAGCSRSSAEAVSHDGPVSAEIQGTRAEGDAAHVANVARAGDERTWQMSAWFLERSNPRRWGRVDRVKAEITARSQGPLVTDEARRRFVTDPRVRELSYRLTELMASPEPSPPKERA